MEIAAAESSPRANVQEDQQPLLSPKVPFPSLPVDELGDAVGPSGSSLVQTIFNTCNLILGVSLLSLPYAFSLSGWIFGGAMIVIFGLVAASSAKILAACQELYLKVTGIPLLTYGDIGESAFGPRGRWFIQLIFSCELFSASVALLILITESLKQVLPEGTLTNVELIMLIWSILTVSTWPKSLSVLSYTSMIGILCIINLVGVVLFDGLYKLEAPGSLWHPAETHLLPHKWNKLPLSFGIFFAGFAGHACFPGFYTAMKRPQKFKFAIDMAFTSACLVYLSIGAAGYLMFGQQVSSLIIENLKDGYPNLLYLITMILVIINPATKYPLTLYPLIADLELLVFGHKPVPRMSKADRRLTSIAVDGLPNSDNTASHSNTSFEGKDDDDDDDQKPLLADISSCEERNVVSFLKRATFRTFVSFAVLIMAILVPEFEKVIGILGCVFSITSSVLFPCMLYLAFFKSRPPACTRLPVDIRSSVSKWNEPNWLVESDLSDWEFVPQWKRTLAGVTFICFACISAVGAAWLLLPFSVLDQQ